MIRIGQIKINVNSNINLLDKIAKILRVGINEIVEYKIVKESIDARYKPDIYYIYEVYVTLKDESVINKIHNKDIYLVNDEKYEYTPKGENVLDYRPVIVGAGPAGLFAAYNLASYGYKPIIIERGEDVDKRVESVNTFLEKGLLNKESNVQFGEGGAGTFSDGKLNTMVKDKFNRGKKVLEVFVENGANEDILYKSHPHIGTDILRIVIKNMRNKMISMGATFMYNTKLTDLVINNNNLEEIIINDNEHIKTNVLVLAIGHSARDTFYMLNNYLKMEAKPFAVGVRVEHKQVDIDISQYGKVYEKLGPSTYKLTHKCKNGRGVYTFCMCPGGYVINSSSEEGMLAINGMSYRNRDSENANSAVIVTVTPDDFGSKPLSGIEYQRNLEKKAFSLGNGSIPIQLYKDFKLNKESINYGSINPLFKGNYKLSNIRSILPDYITDSLIEGIEAFDRKLNGFSNPDTIMAAIESRTSSPVKILRDEEFNSNILGIYPCGEGAGYAGGITSAAIDGLKVSEAIMNKYKKEE